MNFISNALHGLQATWHRLRHDDISHMPLLDSAELAAIQALTQQHAFSLQQNFESSSKLQGDMQGTDYGNGFDFDGLRNYQNNDELRSINWRAYARTHMLHVNIFKEERRPGVFIVLDRRVGMRFGTRHAIKAKFAAGIAAYFTLSALTSNRRAAAACMNQTADWHSYKQGMRSGKQLLDAMIAPCPPAHQPLTETSLNTLLSELPYYTEKGDEIILVSDFHDLDKSSVSALYKLAQNHALRAFHILDSAELQLPDQGTYTIQSMYSDDTTVIDPDTGPVKQRMNASLQKHHEEVENILIHSNARYRKIITQDDLLQTLADIT